MEPKISIIVPVYNVEEYLPATLDNLLSQDYSNYEIVLVDDGSPDYSGRICDEYASKDSRVLVVHKRNEGVTIARKTGVDKCTGEWVIFVDGDDQLKSGALTWFMEKAKMYKADIIQTPNILRTDRGDKLCIQRATGVYDKKGYLNLLSRKFITNGIGGRMIRRSLFNDTTFTIPRAIHNNEDMLMNYHLSDNLQRIYCDHTSGQYVYFQRSSSASHTRTSKENWILLYKELIHLSQVYGMYAFISLVGSLVERYENKDLSLSECRSFANKVKWNWSYPLNTIAEIVFFRHPNKVTNLIRRASESINLRMNTIK